MIFEINNSFATFFIITIWLGEVKIYYYISMLDYFMCKHMPMLLVRPLMDGFSRIGRRYKGMSGE